MERLEKQYYVALDTETTGVDFCNSQVIQCGVVFLDENFSVIKEREWNVNYIPQEFDWDEKAEKIHKIDRASSQMHGVEADVFFRELQEEITSIYGNIAPENLKMIAANAYFDFIMMQQLWKKLYPTDRFFFSHRLVDINTLGVILTGVHSFGGLIRYFGIEEDENLRHSALHDAQLHHQVFLKLRSMLPDDILAI